jgi:hypothetical protein
MTVYLSRSARNDSVPVAKRSQWQRYFFGNAAPIMALVIMAVRRWM